LHQSIRLARLLHGWTGALDSLPRGYELTIALIDLEGDGVGNRIRLGQRLTDARVRQPQFPDALASVE
jgi:hypothetical protein